MMEEKSEQSLVIVMLTPVLITNVTSSDVNPMGKPVSVEVKACKHCFSGMPWGRVIGHNGAKWIAGCRIWLWSGKSMFFK